MAARATEHLHTAAKGLDLLTPDALAAVLVAGQVVAAQCVAGAGRGLAAAGQAAARTIAAGGTLHYFAAGSSGLMAAADALELGGTFSIPPAQIKIHMAGGMPQGVEMPGDVEDGPAHGADDVRRGDTAIFVSASGTTPYTVAAATRVKPTGATLVSLANNPETPLLALADIAICLETPAEVLAGSTRLGAATAQKIALNTISTVMAVALGHVHDGMMVNVTADNAKLRARARRIVQAVSDAPDAVVHDAID
ncbi:MAG: N-acetylmuramic acid 6-phosphate etherase, partial [Pseudomonadota bacterium]